MAWLIVYALLYLTVPYGAYRAVRYWTGSEVAAWAAAIVVIPIGVFVYAQLFERLKHGRWKRLPPE